MASCLLLVDMSVGELQQASRARRRRGTVRRQRTRCAYEGPKITVARRTPEDALRTFMLALISQDEASLRKVTVPNPDLGWLLKGDPLPPR